MSSCHDRAAVLDSSNRADRIGVAQILFVCLRDAPGTNLAFLHEIGHGGSDRLRLDLGIDAVLAAEIDMVGLKAPELPSADFPMVTGEESITSVRSAACWTPNFEAMTTLSRTGASAAPTTSSLWAFVPSGRIPT